MNVDKIRFNHLPKGQKPPELVCKSLNIKVGPKTYVATSSKTGLTKIGRSTYYEDRIRSIEARDKDTLLVVAVFNDDREYKLHKRFDEFRVYGEWFQLDFDQVAQLRKEGHLQ